MKFFTSIKNRALTLGSLGVAGAGLVPTAFADDDVSIMPNNEADKIIGSIVGVVASIFRYIGIVLLAWGIGMLILAFKNEDADSKTKAIMLIVVSIVLISLKTFLGLVLGDYLGTGNGTT